MGRGYGFHLAHIYNREHTTIRLVAAGPAREGKQSPGHAHQPKGAGIVRVPVRLHHITVYATVTTGAAV